MKTDNLLSSQAWPGLTALALSILAVLPGSTFGQTNLVKVDYEWADSVAGPWSKPPSDQTLVQQDGSLLALSDTPQKLFRLNIQQIGWEDVQAPHVPVVELLPSTRSIAEEHLAWLIGSLFGGGSNDPVSGAWSNASLAPIALKVFDLAYKNGTEPAYVEFKIVSDFQPAEKPAEFLVGNEIAPVRDLGHILVSLHDGDAPVPEFSESGPTPCEELLRRVASLSNIKIMRFGSSFATVENEQGELLAQAGSDPFMVPHDFARYKDRTFRGEFDSETAEKPPVDGYGGPRMEVHAYKSYADFKEDYLNNPVYQLMRQRKAQKVAGEWALLRGEDLPTPEVLTATPGEEFVLLAGEEIRRVFLDDDELDDQPLAAVDTLAGGGLMIQGLREGFARLTVETAAGIRHFEFVVPPPPQDDFVPGWQDPQYWWVEGEYSATPRYRQTLDYNLWCSKVGCGPVAWAILLGHWDRERGVPAAFYRNIPGDFTVSDAPYTVEEKTAHMHAVYAALHEYCDVICDPFSQAGATPPGDMIEGGATYLWLPKLFGFLGYKYSWSWDLNDPDWNEPSNRIRTAIKNGRPAIIGLNWMDHYGVAYGYRHQEFKTDPNTVLFRRRWFKVNEGWNKSDGVWYSGSDTFLGASIKAWQKNP